MAEQSVSSELKGSADIAWFKTGNWQYFTPMKLIGLRRKLISVHPEQVDLTFFYKLKGVLLTYYFTLTLIRI